MKRAAFIFAVMLVGFFSTCGMNTASAQAPNGNALGGDSRQPSVQDYLQNSLRAVRPEQLGFIKRVLREVDAGNLTTRQVVAISRYAQRRNPQYPFPFFERAMRFEAAKLNVSLPSVDVIRSTVNPSFD